MRNDGKLDVNSRIALFDDVPEVSLLIESADADPFIVFKRISGNAGAVVSVTPTTTAVVAALVAAEGE